MLVDQSGTCVALVTIVSNHCCVERSGEGHLISAQITFPKYFLQAGVLGIKQHYENRNGKYSLLTDYQSLPKTRLV